VNAWLLTWLFRARLPHGPLAARTAPRPVLDRPLAVKSIAALALFAVLAIGGVEPTGAAITSASLLILTSRITPRRVLAAVDWPLLLFFAALFVVVQGVARTGAIDDVFRWLEPALGRGHLIGWAAFVGLVVVASNLVSNVPLVVIAVHWVPHLPDRTWGWIVLAFASTLAGNLTLFGSVANIIVFEGAGPPGEVGFFRFLRYGAILTAASLIVAFSLLAALHAIGYAAVLGI
jgi:Na+/H+ antiporter NhaD/arsenite permease-like protein